MQKKLVQIRQGVANAFASPGAGLNTQSPSITASGVAIMALPHAPGLTPPEIAFLCEMERVTIIPRQRLEALALLGVCVPPHSHDSGACICFPAHCNTLFRYLIDDRDH